MIISKEKIICKPISTHHILQILQILICRVAYLPNIINMKLNFSEIQPAVITTFALSDLMALSEGAS